MVSIQEACLRNTQFEAFVVSLPLSRELTLDAISLKRDEYFESNVLFRRAEDISKSVSRKCRLGLMPYQYPVCNKSKGVQFPE